MRPVVSCIQVKLIYLSTICIKSDVNTIRTQTLSIIVVNPYLLNRNTYSLRSMLICNFITVNTCSVARYCVLRNGVSDLCVTTELR